MVFKCLCGKEIRLSERTLLLLDLTIEERKVLMKIIYKQYASNLHKQYNKVGDW